MSSSEKNISMDNISLASKSNIENGLDILYFTFLKNKNNKQMDFFVRFITKFASKRILKKRSSKKFLYSPQYSRKVSRKKIQDNSSKCFINNNNEFILIECFYQFKC